MIEDVVTDSLDDYFIDSVKNLLTPFLAGNPDADKVCPPSWVKVDDDDENPDHHNMRFRVSLLWDITETRPSYTRGVDSSDQSVGCPEESFHFRPTVSVESATLSALQSELRVDDLTESEDGILRRVASTVFPRFLGFLVAYDGLMHEDDYEGTYTWSYNDVVPCKEWLSEMVKNMNSHQLKMMPLNTELEYIGLPTPSSLELRKKTFCVVTSPYRHDRVHRPGLGQGSQFECSWNLRNLLANSKWAVAQINPGEFINLLAGVVESLCIRMGTHSLKVEEDPSGIRDSTLVLQSFENCLLQRLIRLLISFLLHKSKSIRAFQLVEGLEACQRSHWELEAQRTWHGHHSVWEDFVSRDNILHVALASARRYLALLTDLERRSELKALCSGKPDGTALDFSDICLIADLIYNSINNKTK